MFEVLPEPAIQNLFFTFLGAGILAVFAYKKTDLDTVRRVSDVLWICLGGASVLTAVLFSEFTDQSGLLNARYSELKQQSEASLNEFGLFVDQHCQESQPPTIRRSDRYRTVACNDLARSFAMLFERNTFANLNAHLIASETVEPPDDPCYATKFLNVPNIWRDSDCEALSKALSYDLNNSVSNLWPTVEQEAEYLGISIQQVIAERLVGLYYDQPASLHYKRVTRALGRLNENADNLEDLEDQVSASLVKRDWRDLALFAIAAVLPLRLMRSLTEFPKMKKAFQ